MANINKITVGDVSYNITIPAGLTEEEQAQVRQNIGAVSAQDVEVVRDGTYPDMTVGTALQDGSGENIAESFQDVRGDLPAYFQVTLLNWTSNVAYSQVIAGLSSSDLIQFIPSDASAALVVNNNVRVTGVNASNQIVFGRDTSFTGTITGTIVRIPWRT